MAIITVSTANDSGIGSLRTAIASAQTGDTITFTSNLANQTINLTSGEIAINKSITINASSAPNLKISGNNKSRIFSINKYLNVSIKGMTLINGRAVIAGSRIGEGGAIQVRDYSRLTVENSTFRGNVAERGGAIRVGYGGSASVINSIFDGNDGSIANDGFSAGAISTYGAGGPSGAGKLVISGSKFTNNKGVNGGAVYVLLGPLSIQNSTFRNNQSLRQGGAIFTDGASGSEADDLGGTTTIVSSHFEGNRAVAGGGALYFWGYKNDRYIVKDSSLIGNSVTRGGPYNVGRGGAIEQGGGSLILERTTVAHNTSPAQGGGLWINNNTASITVKNSTISNNTAQQDAGGGMFLLVRDGRPVNIINSTLVGNHAGRDAGAIWTGGLSRDVTLKNTIFSKNSAAQTRQGNTNFQLKDGGGNFVENLSGNKGPKVTATAMYVNNLKLGSLQKIGNDFLHPLLQGSPAINSGVSGAPTSDQRGIQRDIAPDVGAYELTSSDINAVPTNMILKGTARNDFLFGGPGNDSLYGGAGQDTLTGGLGKDRFDLTTTRIAGLDILTDFNANDDQILVSKSEFGLVQAAGSLLQPEMFRLGSIATTANHRFIYDSSTGNLFFDKDGLGGTNQVQIAILSNNAPLSSSDFTVIV